MKIDQRGDGIRVVHPLFQEEGGGANPTSPLQLAFGQVELETAISLNRLWHSRLPNVVASNIYRSKASFCYAAEYDGIFYATAIWSSPVARFLNDKNWIELRRLAISPDAPKNTASRMLAWMVRDVRGRGFDRAISYQDTEVHKGTIYKAAGWSCLKADRGGGWSRPSRVRAESQSTAPKIRWELAL